MYNVEERGIVRATAAGYTARASQAAALESLRPSLENFVLKEHRERQ